MFTIIEIEAKRTVLESTKRAALDAANLALAPLQAQIQQLQDRVHQVVVPATAQIGQIDGQLALLAELAKEFAPKTVPPDPKAPRLMAVPPIEEPKIEAKAAENETAPATVSN